MKPNLKFLLSSLLLLAFLGHVQAQDTIYRKNGRTIQAKILELSADEIKYKMFTQPNGATIVIDVALVKKIVFENGTVHKFDGEESGYTNPEYYVGQKRSAYKVSFISPLLGFTAFTYERNLKPGRSYEVRLGIVGLGRNIEKQRGVYLMGGYKFYNTPDYYSNRQRYAHLLKGSYIRPEVGLGTYSFDPFGPNVTLPSNVARRRTATYGLISLNVGKQWIFDNSVALDFFGGIGMGFLTFSKSGSNTFEYYTRNSNYGNFVNQETGLAFTFGINIGFLGK